MAQDYYKQARPEEKALADKLTVLRVTELRAEFAASGDEKLNVKNEENRWRNQIAYYLIFSPPHSDVAKTLNQVAEHAPEKPVSDEDLAGWYKSKRPILNRLNEALTDADRTASTSLRALEEYVGRMARSQHAAGKKVTKENNEPVENGHAARQKKRNKPTRERE